MQKQIDILLERRKELHKDRLDAISTSENVDKECAIDFLSKAGDISAQIRSIDNLIYEILNFNDSGPWPKEKSDI